MEDIWYYVVMYGVRPIFYSALYYPAELTGGLMAIALYTIWKEW